MPSNDHSRVAEEFSALRHAKVAIVRGSASMHVQFSAAHTALFAFTIIMQ